MIAVSITRRPPKPAQCSTSEREARPERDDFTARGTIDARSDEAGASTP